MATGYQGAGSYAGYGSPERTKVDRARQMAELLQQGATDTSPKSFWEGAAQLGKAFIARDAMGKAEKAESAYADKTRQMAETIIGQAYNDPGAVAAPLSLTPGNVAATAGGLKQGGDNKRYGDMARAMLGYTGGDLGAAMGAAQVMQRQDVEAKQYAEGLAYRDKTDARRNFVDDRLFGAGRDDAARQAGQWQQSFDQSGNQFTATMEQDADQFRTTSDLSAAQLAEQRRQFDIEQAARKAEAEAKAEASANGLFDDPQRAKIYADSMDAVDAATKDQRRLDTIARTASQFVEDSKDWNSQGEGWWNDLGQALSMDTTSLKQLTDTIAPLVREPGSGGNSDADVAMFKSSVVSINNPREANVRFAKGAQALAARNKEYVTYLSDAIEPNDPKSRQNANRIWLAYANENPMFDPKTGEVQTPPRFKDWLDVKMGNAPPVNSFIGKRVQAALPQAPTGATASDASDDEIRALLGLN